LKIFEQLHIIVLTLSINIERRRKMTVADRVKERREELGISQEELAHRMGLKSRSSITRIEKSGDDITLKDVERLSKALNCSPLYLMGWDPDEKKQDSRDEIAFNVYSQLNDDQKTLIDNMLTALSSKS
jgi:transcriptional regulator with XRE-family HTH domain